MADRGKGRQGGGREQGPPRGGGRGPRTGRRPAGVPPAVQVDRPARAPAGERPAPRPPRDEAPRPPRAAREADAVAGGDPREVRLYGVNACLGVFAHRRGDIIRGYFTEATGRRHFGPLMKFLAQERLAYHLVTDAEMERIAGSGHHEGVCLLVRARPARSADDWLMAHRRAKQGCVVALENVGNPHNLGAILRVCAHFGVPAVLVPDARAMTSGAAARTAEGGAEFVEVLDAPDFHATLRDFRAAGWRIVTTSSHGGRDIYKAELPPRCVILFGEEGQGLSPAALAGGDLAVRIPGTGKVESLNVSVAAGILAGEWWRQQRG